jgi:pimeloyl-ACP methyl ester carboxylesterase
MKGELVSVNPDSKIDLVGFLCPCPKPTKKVFVMSHGRGGTFYSGYGSFLPHIISSAHKQNFDFLGVSDSGSGFFRIYDIFESCLKDYKSWLKFCEERGYTEIILGSHSYGPIKIAYFYHKIKPKRVIGLFFLAPTDTFGRWKKYVGRKAEKYLKLARQMVTAGKEKDLMPNEAYYNPISAISYLSLYGGESKIHIFDFHDPQFEFKILREIKIPVLTVLGEKDKNPLDAAPETKIKILNSILQNPTSALIEDADHLFTNKGAELEKIIELWLKKF